MGLPRGVLGDRDAVGDRILGVDPGTVVTGWGVVDARSNKLGHVASGVLRLSGSRASRLARLHQEIDQICGALHPGVVVIEQSFVGDNVQTALRLGEARGAVMVAAAQRDLPVCEYAPAAIKIAVAGSGRAAKDQIQFMVARLLGLDRSLRHDEADALAAAICHAHARTGAALLGDTVAFRGRRRGGRRASWRELRLT